MPNKNRLSHLFRKYLQNKITDSELEELFESIKEAKEDDILKEYIVDIYRETRSDAYDTSVDWDTMFSEIVKDEAEISGRSAAKISLWRNIAAAVILLVVGTIGAYLYFNENNNVISGKTEAVNQKRDILPGGNKATLTLSNGSTMVLDSTVNGKLAGQGNINIVKVDSGVLAYQKQKTTNPNEQIQYNTLTTPRGGQFQLTLSDGTKVWLNAASSIRYPVAFNGKERKVEVTGEVYFEVAQNAKQPFRVHFFSDGQDRERDIQVLGTHFNVHAYSDESVVKTTLLEGAIKIKNKVLNPGEQAIMEDGHLRILKDVDLQDVVAWKNGFFAFDNANLKDIMRKLSRWYDIDVIYEPGVDNEQRFSGRIDRSLTLSQILNGLKQTRAHFKIEANRKVIILH